MQHMLNDEPTELSAEDTLSKEYYKVFMDEHKIIHNTLMNKACISSYDDQFYQVEMATFKRPFKGMFSEYKSNIVGGQGERLYYVDENKAFTKKNNRYGILPAVNS